ncbi:hypothetical protein DUZ99_05560 [Xylanibacillus composti]|uniref:Uncharacterized protein n=1 Tax=Xylanibacillus composti TaxID=1572762 RepID=A0A8J4H555_9BACL|nr:hypothetical protein [Xylanibacillus composti]MDT9724455.1 hypothetical protein [Xylanibacillus composti]GIQ69717.1 hypothetical protein XYCOK13_25410 [Xylanibacillus composti]
MDWKGKLAVSLVLLALGVWIGMNGAAGGMERIHGPFSEPVTDGSQSLQESFRDAREQPVPAGLSVQPWSEHEGMQDGEAPWHAAHDPRQPHEAGSLDQPADVDPWRPEPRRSFVEKAADQTGAFVQHTAQKSLEALIAWFESATD